jgi:ABC-type antimicrobial peptide transport system permease subunit
MQRIVTALVAAIAITVVGFALTLYVGQQLGWAILTRLQNDPEFVRWIVLVTPAMPLLWVPLALVAVAVRKRFARPVVDCRPPRIGRFGT